MPDDVLDRIARKELDRRQKAGPEKVDPFDPPAIVAAILKGARHRFPTIAEQLVSLNTILDAFDSQYRMSDRESPGGKFIFEAMNLLQKAIETLDPQGKLGGTT